MHPLLAGFSEELRAEMHKEAGPDLPGQAQGVFARGKQLLSGERVSQLRRAYQEGFHGPHREELLKELANEDNRAFAMQTGTALAGTGAGIAGGQALSSFVGGKVVPYLQRKGLQLATGTEGQNEDGSERTPEEIYRESAKSLGVNPDGFVGRTGERAMLSANDSHRVTMDDLVGLNGPVGGAGGRAVLMGAAQAKLVQPMAANLLGAQTFYHGTDRETAPKILQHGIDPGYGGIPSGQAAKLTEQGRAASQLESDAARLEEAQQHGEATKLRIRATHERPKYPLSSAGQEPVPLNTERFQSNAEGRTYTGRGEAGRVAVLGYAMRQNPELKDEAVEAFRNSPGVRARTEALDGRNSAGEKVSPLRRVAQGVRTMAPGPQQLYDAATMLKGPHDVLLNPGKDKTHTIGGVMPVEKYDAMFEPDPDDVTRAQTGHRTRTERKVAPGQLGTAEAIAPEHLNANSPTLKQVWQNRTKLPMREYLKKYPGRVGTGLAQAGVQAGLMGLQGLNAYHAINPLVQKAKGTFKTKADLESTKEARLSGLTNGERLDAAEQPTFLQGHGAHIVGGLAGADFGNRVGHVLGLGATGKNVGSVLGLIGGARLGGAATRAIAHQGVDEAQTPEELEKLRTSPAFDHAPALGMAAGAPLGFLAGNHPILGGVAGGMIGAQVRGERLRHVARAKEKMEGGE